ncbi:MULTISPECIES: DUF58 domain-containing protein [Bacillaceae]|uniref:DUF58 domain-containing protein n=1 Tax=Evansella alkalicola TaxID=745819 RepID=A0ABS6JPC6_9BACI|nr:MULTISPECIES: DUF58 domain-containing protein [Bacillaceae]MBU9720112.1 DUF58 domain-containing protein [Bacillus alkalicola]
MTQWRKEIQFKNSYYILTYIVPFLAIISFFSNERFLFSLTILLLLALGVNAHYMTYVSKKIIIPGEKFTKRLFIGDEANLLVPFENRGKIPIFRVKANLFLFDVDKSIEVIEEQGTKQHMTNYEYPFAISPFSRRTINMQGKALKRGTAELRTIELRVSDLFLFGHMKLYYEGPFRGELVVYPKPLPIKGFEQMVQQEKGDYFQPYSLHEEMLMRGNRQYVSEDPFNRINWKATAKTDQLQTKMYEKVIKSQWTFVLNIRNENRAHPTIENLEEVLSHVAYASHFATRHRISFELFINLRVPGSKYGLHISAGEGDKHLTRVLETLARIRKSNLSVPSDHLLSYVFKERITPPLILHFGAVSEAEEQEYRACMQRGGRVFYVNTEESEAVLSAVSNKERIS